MEELKRSFFPRDGAGQVTEEEGRSAQLLLNCFSGHKISHGL